jgi:ATP-dependent protease ClpP protease subunit
MQYECRIFGLIGPRGFGDVCAIQLQDEIDAMQLTPNDVLVVRIASPGGVCSEARAMYGMLRNVSCRTVALIEGDAQQCASYVAMACNTVRMMDHALLSIAEPWAAVSGSADVHRRVADMLDIEAGTMVAGYAYASRQTREQIAAWMTDNEGDGTVFRAAEALRAGLADEIVPADGSIGRRDDDDDDETDDSSDADALRARLQPSWN